MKRTHPHSPSTMEALQLLGSLIHVGRMERLWTLQELADRVGVTKVTILKAERGDPSVSLGIAFEAATLVGVPLFSVDERLRSVQKARLDDRFTVLPKAVRRSRTVNDAF